VACVAQRPTRPTAQDEPLESGVGLQVLRAGPDAVRPDVIDVIALPARVRHRGLLVGRAPWRGPRPSQRASLSAVRASRAVPLSSSSSRWLLWVVAVCGGRRVGDWSPWVVKDRGLRDVEGVSRMCLARMIASSMVDAGAPAGCWGHGVGCIADDVVWSRCHVPSGATA